MSALAVTFRVDSSAELGSGHVMRCLTLADELRRRGACVRFICRELPGNLIDRVEQADYPVRPLAVGSASNRHSGHEPARYLGVRPEQDAIDTLSALEEDQRPGWLVVDHYGLGIDWERAIRPAVERLLVIEDLAERPHECDVLLDQNWLAQDADNRYHNRVPPACVCLLGPRYALLQPEYARLRVLAPTREGPVRRLLVFFGGSDSTDETGKVLDALATPEFAHLAVDVVIGCNHPDRSGLIAKARANSAIVFHENLPSLAGLMLRADLAIGGSGATSWERICLGLPSLITTLAANQERIAASLAAVGAVRSIGRSENTTSADYRRALRESLRGAAPIAALVDGFGAKRVAETLMPSDMRSLVTRPAGIDGRVQRLVAECAGLPVARLQIELERDEAVLSYEIDPVVREGEVARWVLGEALRRVRRAGRQGYEARDQAVDGGVLVRMHRKPNASAQDRRFSVVVLSDRNSWVNVHLCAAVQTLLEEGHRVLWAHDPCATRAADLCFLLSWPRRVSADFRRRFRHTLVVHASDLPRGRGMSPLTWQILAGENRIVVSLLEAEDEVDSGDIYLQETLCFTGSELLGELQNAVGAATVRLCRQFVAAYCADGVTGRRPTGEPTHYPRRRAADSKLDPHASIASQFDLLRVVDNDRYPAFFEHRGRQYVLRVEAQDRCHTPC